jgi:hypothetical protein
VFVRPSLIFIIPLLLADAGCSGGAASSADASPDLGPGGAGGDGGAPEGTGGTGGGAGGTGGGGAAGTGGGGQGGISWGPSTDPCSFPTTATIGDWPPPRAPFACCAPGRACPSGQTCFMVSAERGVCDDPQPALQTMCSPPDQPIPAMADECGCSGLTCASDQICARAYASCSCNYTPYWNACVQRACAAASDCAAGTVCTPSSLILWPSGVRCVTPSCTRDADCTDGPNGRCLLVIAGPVQAGPPADFRDIHCIYPGPPTAQSCGGAGAGLILDPPNGYYCGPLPAM